MARGAPRARNAKMPALNFQARFAADVESGAKRQTIRALRRDGRDPKPGQPLYLFTGLRTTSSRRLCVTWGAGPIFVVDPRYPLGHVVECRSARPIVIAAWGKAGEIKINGRWLGTYSDPPRTARELARADGFADVHEMIAWIRGTHGLPFEGFVTRW